MEAKNNVAARAVKTAPTGCSFIFVFIIFVVREDNFNKLAALKNAHPSITKFLTYFFFFNV